jgi:hypothetical protein
MDMTPFTNNGNNSCSYNIAANLIYYKNRVATSDLILEDVLAPSNKWSYARFNPICSKPKVKVRNNGNVAINGITFQYGVKNTGNVSTYIWNGTLDAYKSIEIELENPIFGDSTQFNVTASPTDTGLTDYDMSNNSFVSKFNLVKILPPRFAIEFRANAVPSENYYEILDATGNVVHLKDNFKANTMHRDTISFTPGCYTFILHDLDKDGLSFFANSDGLGSIRFRNMAGTYFQSFNANFGTDIRYQFIIDPTKVGVNTIEEDKTIKLYPNPASDKLQIEFHGNEELKLIKLSTISGALIQVYENMTGIIENGLVLPKLSNGMYLIEIETNNHIFRQKLQINNR